MLKEREKKKGRKSVCLCAGTSMAPSSLTNPLGNLKVRSPIIISIITISSTSNIATGIIEKAMNTLSPVA